MCYHQDFCKLILIEWLQNSKKNIFIDVDLNDRGNAFVNNNDFENSFNSGISPSSPHSERKNGAIKSGQWQIQYRHGFL